MYLLKQENVIVVISIRLKVHLIVIVSVLQQLFIPTLSISFVLLCLMSSIVF